MRITTANPQPTLPEGRKIWAQPSAGLQAFLPLVQVTVHLCSLKSAPCSRPALQTPNFQKSSIRSLLLQINDFNLKLLSKKILPPWFFFLPCGNEHKIQMNCVFQAEDSAQMEGVTFSRTSINYYGRLSKEHLGHDQKVSHKPTKNLNQFLRKRGWSQLVDHYFSSHQSWRKGPRWGRGLLAVWPPHLQEKWSIIKGHFCSRASGICKLEDDLCCLLSLSCQTTAMCRKNQKW